MGNVLTTLPIVVGLGSDHGDDQAGWIVANRLRDLGYPQNALYLASHPADLLDVVDARRPLVLCDACIADEVPGHVRRISWPTDCLLDHSTRGTHDLSLSQILILGQQLQALPPTVTIWTIEGHAWVAGSPATKEIESAAIRVADEIWNIVRSHPT